ncbi:Tubulin polymerization-promoting protein member 2 [Quaeritorhiza haematococci]|nr:Tubulin polymerization-promoting protein member 2 [Quaeritorhiza haematococci]
MAATAAPPTLPAELRSGLRSVYDLYASFGRKRNPLSPAAAPLPANSTSSSCSLPIDSFRFNKLCKDTGIVDNVRVFKWDVDLVFQKARFLANNSNKKRAGKPKGHKQQQRNLDWGAFLTALGLLAELRFPATTLTEGSDVAMKMLVEEVIERGSKGPKLKRTTAPEAVGVFDRLTNASFYTGMHRYRFAEDGMGLGLEGRDSWVEDVGQPELLVNRDLSRATARRKAVAKALGIRPRESAYQESFGDHFDKSSGGSPAGSDSSSIISMEEYLPETLLEDLYEVYEMSCSWGSGSMGRLSVDGNGTTGTRHAFGDWSTRSSSSDNTNRRLPTSWMTRSRSTSPTESFSRSSSSSPTSHHPPHNQHHPEDQTERGRSSRRQRQRKSPPQTMMDNFHFSKFARNCGLIDGSLVTLTDVDIIFQQSRAHNKSSNNSPRSSMIFTPASSSPPNPSSLTNANKMYMKPSRRLDWHGFLHALSLIAELRYSTLTTQEAFEATVSDACAEGLGEAGGPIPTSR